MRFPENNKPGPDLRATLGYKKIALFAFAAFVTLAGSGVAAVAGWLA